MFLQNKRSHTFSLSFVPMQTSYKTDVEEDNCNETQCYLTVPVSSLDSEYCAWTKGFSDTWLVTTEQSKELCVTTLDGKHMEGKFLLVLS